MPLARIARVRLAGIAAAVPRLESLSWEEFGGSSDEFSGPRRRGEKPFRRRARAEDCQSDYCLAAAQTLLPKLGWEPSEIDLLVMATLTPDYPIPATAIILQDRLGAQKTAAAFDLPSGSLGFIHGLQIVASMLSGGGLKRALLFTGEVAKTTAPSGDIRSHQIIHGHSGSVCALEFQPEGNGFYFDTGGDGALFRALHMPVGGVRNPPRSEMFADEEGFRFATDYVLDSEFLAKFAITALPQSILRIVQASGKTLEEIDDFHFTPLSLPAEEEIRRRTGIPLDRFHGLVGAYGSSGSGSQPLSLLTHCATDLRQKFCTSLLVGVGPGLCWGSALIETSQVVCPPIVEI